VRYARGIVWSAASGISPDRAADMLWFYFGPNAWYSLVGDRAWTFDQAESWLREAARRDLLDADRAGVPGRGEEEAVARLI
jgi:hypothetical protein